MLAEQYWLTETRSRHTRWPMPRRREPVDLQNTVALHSPTAPAHTTLRNTRAYAFVLQRHNDAARVKQRARAARCASCADRARDRPRPGRTPRGPPANRSESQSRLHLLKGKRRARAEPLGPGGQKASVQQASACGAPATGAVRSTLPEGEGQKASVQQASACGAPATGAVWNASTCSSR